MDCFERGYYDLKLTVCVSGFSNSLDQKPWSISRDGKVERPFSRRVSKKASDPGVSYSPKRVVAPSPIPEAFADLLQ